MYEDYGSEACVMRMRVGYVYTSARHRAGTARWQLLRKPLRRSRQPSSARAWLYPHA